MTISSSRVPPSAFLIITGAYDYVCISRVDLLPCIVGKAPFLESHERVVLIQLVILKDDDTPLCALSNTVLVDALHRS